MKVKITIKCGTINELHLQLKELATQIKRSAKKQNLDPSESEFQNEDADSLCISNHRGTCEVKIKKDKTTT